MSYTVEQDWPTKAGLRAVVIKTDSTYLKHRCGYVGVPITHPCYGKQYGNQIATITQEMVAGVRLGSRSLGLAVTAGVRSDGPGLVRRSLDILIDVHGGLTYSSSEENSEYPVDSDLWWFGFDCGHYGDDEDGGQSLEYCIQQCESMAQQFKDLVK